MWAHIVSRITGEKKRVEACQIVSLVGHYPKSDVVASWGSVKIGDMSI